jgi:hypothetical protein
MKLPADAYSSGGVSCEILRSHNPPSPRLRRVLLTFIPVAAYSAKQSFSAAKAGSYGILGEGESNIDETIGDKIQTWHMIQQHHAVRQ